MTAFLAGVVAVLGIGAVVAVVWDEEVRDAAIALLFAVLTLPIFLVWYGAVTLIRLLPDRIRPRLLRGRALSPAALRRVADRVQHDGWMISSRRASIVIIRRKVDR